MPTGLILVVPDGHMGHILPRSSLALHEGLDVGAGVLDSDYRGAVGVVMFNHTDKDYVVKQGQKCAQLVLKKISVPDVIEVKEVGGTRRGANGFGSTNSTNA